MYGGLAGLRHAQLKPAPVSTWEELSHIVRRERSTTAKERNNVVRHRIHVSMERAWALMRRLRLRLSYAVKRPTAYQRERGSGQYRQLWRCGVALIVFGVSAILLHWLQPPLSDRYAYLIFLATVTISALYGGLAGGITASIGSTIFALYDVVEPAGSFRITEESDIEGLVLFVLASAVLCAFIHAFHRAAARLERERRLVKATLTSIGDAVITTDSRGRVTTLNATAEALTGWSQHEASGRPLDVVFRLANEETGDAVDSPVTTALRDHATVALANHTLLIRRDGARTPIDDSAAPIFGEEGRILGAVLVFRDITERKRLSEQLNQRQRLESLGILAGGVAHDFNNLLAGILGNASVLEKSVLSAGDREAVQDILRSGTHAADLTRQLLAYAGKGKSQSALLNISEMARDVARLAGSTKAPHVELLLELEPGLPPVKGDPGQIEQLLLNLVINAVEAVPDTRAGKVRVRTATCEVGAGEIRGQFDTSELAPGSYVRIEVSDNGVGIDPSTQTRMFEPFFTTKFSGRGLGLSAVLGIVNSHRGGILVESTPGHGTVFRVLLPASSEPWPEEKRSSATAPPVERKTILVVDDEELLRTLSARILEANGYRVIAVESGSDALALLQQNGAEISAVLLDLTMPGMSGEATLCSIQRIRPDLPVFLSSGYHESEVLQRVANARVAGFLQKPYTSDVLLARLREGL